MKPEAVNVRHDRDPERIAQLEAMAKTATIAALSALHTDTRSVEAGTSLSTCMVAMTAEMAKCMANLDRDAASEILELMSYAVRRGTPSSGPERQRMFKAQQHLAHGEISLVARMSARGTA